MQPLSLRIPCFASSLMSLVAGVVRFDGCDASDAFLFGSTGHAFLMNIHPELCPSGPYCFDRRPFYALARNLGLSITDHGFYGIDSMPEARGRVEEIVWEALDQGRPAGFVNMEYQAVVGTDETGFLVLDPWGREGSPAVTHLTFRTWEELGKEVHVNFFTFARTEAKPRRQAVAEALRYGVELWQAPYDGRYANGQAAYRIWREALPQHGAGHGCWWNGVVWQESRSRAADFFSELAAQPDYPGAAELAALYAQIAEALRPLTDREASVETKSTGLSTAEMFEREAVKGMGALADALLPSTAGRS